MSLVTVQLGQCGNQIGGQLFSTIIDDVHNNSLEKSCSKRMHEDYEELVNKTFFNVTQKKDGGLVKTARAVLIDMEPKVIAQTAHEAKRSGKWQYSTKQQFCLKRGSGNNWAHGFCSHGPAVREDVMNIVRREVEKCDHFGGFLALMSLAGGTGSGVGAYTTECLREEFPNCFIVNQVVWPYHTGEVIVQNYNAILTLSRLYQSSDAVITQENDVLHRICSQLLGIPKVSFQDINRVVSHKLASILQPAYKSGDVLVDNLLGELLEQLVAHPQYKLLSLINIPQMSENSKHYSAYQWPGLLKHLRQMLIANAPMEEGINWQVKATSSSDFNKSIANVMIARGVGVDTVDLRAFSDRHLYVPWMPSSSAFSAYTHSRCFNAYEKSVSLLSNSQAPVPALDAVISKAWHMFASRAYVHQYLKHGLCEEEFLDSFASLEQVLVSYKCL